MILTGNQAKEYIRLSNYSKITQAGVDLSVQKIEIILNNGISVLKDKTIIPSSNYQLLETQQIEGTECWQLYKGYCYSVTFNEGIKVPLNYQAKVTHRSSIYRIGNIIESPWWDAGFECDNMNSTLIVNNYMIVEKNARLAQVVFHLLTENTQEAYNGQWQGLSSATHS